MITATNAIKESILFDDDDDDDDDDEDDGSGTGVGAGVGGNDIRNDSIVVGKKTKYI